jgi:hypothetical protein
MTFGQASPIAAAFWIAQSTEPSTPVAWFTQLGAFSVALGVGFYAYRDLQKRNDRQLEAVEKLVPVFVQFPVLLQASTDTLRAAADAMAAMSETIKGRALAVDELVRVRDLLQELQRVQEASPRRRT